LTYFEKTKNILQLLLEAGADIDARGKTDETALGEAAFLGDKRLFKLILEQGPNINAVGGMFGTTLQAAAWHGNEDLVIMLLEKNADFNLQGGIFGNALQAAVAADARGIARHLFSFGARVDSPGEEWELLLQKIYEFGYSERILDRLRKFQENPRLYLGIGEHPIIIN
jgi:ankyrin repeat protein